LGSANKVKRKAGQETTNGDKLLGSRQENVGLLRGDDDQPDLFWTKKAGLEAGRLAEALQRWSQALSVYQRLTNLLPSVSATLENRIQNAEKNLRLTR